MEKLIIKYLTNQATDKEIDILNDWLKTKENQLIFKSYVKSNQELNQAYQKNIDFKTVYKRIEKATYKKVLRINSFYKQTLKYAAVILLMISSFFLIQRFPYKQANIDTTNLITLELENGHKTILKDNHTSDIVNEKGVIIASLKNNKLSYHFLNNNQAIPFSHHKLTVPNGKIFTVELADKTVVSINSGSELKYLSNNNHSKNRIIHLKGEAYFNVTKNKEKPFIVRTRDLNVKVLGTKFNVSSYQNEEITSVVLEEGSVSLNKSSEKLNFKNGIVIKPSQKAQLQYDKFLVNNVAVKKYVAWKKRQLQFKNDRFKDIIKELERFYNITIEIDSSSINEVRYTGHFTTESITEVLTVFKEFSKFDFKILPNKVIISQPN